MLRNSLHHSEETITTNNTIAVSHMHRNFSVLIRENVLIFNGNKYDIRVQHVKISLKMYTLYYPNFWRKKYCTDILRNMQIQYPKNLSISRHSFKKTFNVNWSSLLHKSLWKFFMLIHLHCSIAVVIQAN